MAGPCFHLFSAWITEEESSTLVGFGFSGYTFGTILTYWMSGIMCSTQIGGVGGWPLIYYAPGKKKTVVEIGRASRDDILTCLVRSSIRSERTGVADSVPSDTKRQNNKNNKTVQVHRRNKSNEST